MFKRLLSSRKKSSKVLGPINLAYISSLKPCQSRLDNYVSHYKDFDGSLAEFFDLGELTHVDKLWVAFRLLDRKQVVECTCRFAESVLSIYESKYPDDDRPRQAIVAARSGNADAYAAADAAAYAAAYAADAAYAAADAAYAAYAAAAYAADAAAYAADAAAGRSNTASLRSGGPDLEASQLKTILEVYAKG